MGLHARGDTGGGDDAEAALGGRPSFASRFIVWCWRPLKIAAP
jgi:hypothetical protein